MKKLLLSAGIIAGLAGSALAQGAAPGLSPDPDYPLYVEANGIQYWCRDTLTTLPDGTPARLCRRLSSFQTNGGAALPATVGIALLGLALLGDESGSSSGTD
ncbi:MULTISPECIES: hypothetical protein [Marinovum]|uniref:hypothetical protein n=1 Tax=Marinovum TaxID=367771 RepID=UPI00237C0166|nr:hypothetical protein [Marinovum sp. PR37]MDD9745224.1 hypothetical protein [Marinovum sp. PR37]